MKNVFFSDFGPNSNDLQHKAEWSVRSRPTQAMQVKLGVIWVQSNARGAKGSVFSLIIIGA